MKSSQLRLIALVAFVCILHSSCSTKKKADLILYNGFIYTVDSAFTIAEAIVINEGKIEATGHATELLDEYEAERKVDLHGLPVYPGFIDAHCHFFGYACDLMKGNVFGTQSFEEVVDRVSAFSRRNTFSWILGRGWDQNDWTEKSFPVKDTLDKLFPSTPVFLERIDGHAAICNQVALDLAHVTERTKVPGGEVVLRNGKTTGVLIDNAVELVSRMIPPFSETIFTDVLKKAEANCFAVGLTTLCDAGLGRDSIDLIDKLQKKGFLKMRIYAMISDMESNRKYWIDRGPYKSDRLHVRSFKLYADGALGSRGACLLQPYADMNGRFGFLLREPSYIRMVADEALAKGFQLNTHCIGDSAVRLILNIYADHLKGKNNLRWRIEHCQITDPGDRHLFGDNNVIPSVQPTHATSDMYWVSTRLGDRINNSYAYEELRRNSNQFIVFGTDFPVENINPVYTFYAAVERKDLKNFPDGGFQPENKTSRENTLRAMTVWAAYSCFEENEKGSLEKGKVADFVILDKDLMKIPPGQIPATKVLATYIGGEKVYGK